MVNYQETNSLNLEKSLESYRQTARALIENPSEHNAVETNIASMKLFDSIYLLRQGDEKLFEDYVELFFQELQKPLKTIEHMEKHYRRIADTEKRKYNETRQEKIDPIMIEKIRELEIILRNLTSSSTQMRWRKIFLTGSPNHKLRIN